MDSAEIRRPHHRRKMPSFSSTLLDSIYRSIDEPTAHDEEQHKSSILSSSLFSDSRDVPSLRRAIMIDKWIENRSISSQSSRHLNSSSSDSSYGGIFSSSESSVSSIEKPKLAQAQAQARSCMFIRSERSETPKHEGRFMRKTRSTAMKILKQPISPRIANFLNSLFNSRTVRRTKVTKLDESIEDIAAMRKSRSAKDISTTHRSCLSTKSNSNSNRLKRSVRFCPVSIIVDEQCRPCGQKSIYEDDMKNAQKSIGASRYDYREFKSNIDDVDDDVESCSSSDLFELENIGVFTEELPVYGTTNLKTNYAIANGLIKL